MKNGRIDHRYLKLCHHIISLGKLEVKERKKKRFLTGIGSSRLLPVGSMPTNHRQPPALAPALLLLLPLLLMLLPKKRPQPGRRRMPGKRESFRLEAAAGIRMRSAKEKDVMNGKAKQRFEEPRRRSLPRFEIRCWYRSWPLGVLYISTNIYIGYVYISSWGVGKTNGSVTPILDGPLHSSTPSSDRFDLFFYFFYFLFFFC